MYLWVKAFHLIAVITWFAGMFYLPRLFGYHAMGEDDTGRARLAIMERKLYRGIMTPSAVVAVALGLWLVVLAPGWMTQGWLHVKLALVVVLIGYHLYCGHLVRAFREGRNRRSDVWYRWFNEIPVLVLVAIVVLVIVKPF